MEIESLKDLKAKNANDNEAEEAPEVEEVKDTELIDDYVEEVEESKAVEEESEPEEEEGKEETEIESWMQSEETEDSGFIPNAEAKQRRLQNKTLRAEVREKDSELEQLRAENERLKAASSVEEEKIPPRPKREDFDFDDDAYDAAVDAWNDKKLEIKLNNHSKQSTAEADQKRTQEQQTRQMQERVSSHYEKANQLVNDNKVSAEAYKAADGIVRSELEVLYPGNGDLAADKVISILSGLGEGSEKVMYQLGVNAEKRGRLMNLLQTDYNGAMAYLGQLHSSVSAPTKRNSKAPKPAPKASGEGGASGKAGTLLKQYQKAGKEGDVQARISLKRKAKAQGIDVTNWS